MITHTPFFVERTDKMMTTAGQIEEWRTKTQISKKEQVPLSYNPKTFKSVDVRKIMINVNRCFSLK